MKELRFVIWYVSADMCRIEATDCRKCIKEISDGACICSLDVMLSEMRRIKNEAEKLGCKATFEII